ncbi:Fe3+/spermidine/putrescine ABC transporter ATP-binding protein [Mycolicibacterium agri]|uniref:Trehalose import ATP-binding protein SugC n=1 Tax=Mycolicibacterium agri TaxID=36811 RepID=A0A2A7N879_MYCAG|nr:ABC transporter ATP-binding protein [Mycolicibacterium agri]PEG39983.1 Fe3+/spermidine/putrescine ABC transporter ATP-binding protein [Mycolicibacterium agri]
MIKIDGLHKRYPDQGATVAAVDGVSFEVAQGELYTLLGPSGCGKTTTLRCVAGLERPDSGTIRLGDAEVFSASRLVPTHKRDLGMVFQSYAIWPHMTVFENAAFPLRVAGRRNRAKIDEAVGEALSLVGLSGYESRMATQLSGGQQQRLSLARALVRRPAVLLLDEPLSNLDAKLREHMRQEIRQLQQRLKITTLFVTHDQIEALAMSDRVAVLRDGKIEQEASPKDIYNAPTSEFVANFVGATNIVKGTVLKWSAEFTTLETKFGELYAVSGPDPLPEGSEVSVAIRPEDLRLAEQPASSISIDQRNVWPVEVMFASFTGAITEFKVVTESGQDIIVRGPSRTAIGQRHVVMCADPAVCRILPDSRIDAAV